MKAKLTALALATLFSGAALAASPVIATINGQTVTLDDYRQQASRLPAEYFEGAEAAKTRKYLFDELVNDALLLDAANAAKVQDTPEYAQRLAEFREYLSRELYLSNFLKTKVTDADLIAAYKAEYEDGNRSKEIKARHILVKTKDEANAIIAQLEKGANFAELAQQKSSDPNKIQGGDLGFFDYDTMVPAFSEAAFKLDKGKYTKTPVETPFGWHVILVEDVRKKDAPPFDEVKDRIRQDLSQKAIEAQLAQLKKAAKITINQDELKKAETEKPVPAPGAADPENGTGQGIE